ncbi:MAG TPA: hypothetical protein VI643_05415 [Planctomycetota bacterium]|nr:hypothetical protein [Planctomycetota bacterium]
MVRVFANDKSYRSGAAAQAIGCPTPPLEVKPGSRPRPGQIETRDKDK